MLRVIIEKAINLTLQVKDETRRWVAHVVINLFVCFQYFTGVFKDIS